MANFYKKFLFPYLLEKALSSPLIMQKRKALLAHARGAILEMGVGTGLNLNLYPSHVLQLHAIDISAYSLHPSAVTVNFSQQSMEALSFANCSFDTVVSTFNFCSVRDYEQALSEIHRVLKPDGQLLFLEHGQALSPLWKRVQNICTPGFKLLACGCHLNRNHYSYLRNNGFSLEHNTVESIDVLCRRLIGYIYSGTAYKI